MYKILKTVCKNINKIIIRTGKKLSMLITITTALNVGTLCWRPVSASRGRVQARPRLLLFVCCFVALEYCIEYIINGSVEHQPYKRPNTIGCAHNDKAG